MFPFLRLALIIAALAVWPTPDAPTIAAPSVPPVVGLVLNEDGNTITVIDPASYRIIKQHDLKGILNKPHLAAYDSGSRRLYVGNKGSNLAVFDVSDVLAPRLLANVKPGGDGEIHRVVIAEGLVWLAHEGDSAVYGYDLNLNNASAPKVALGKEQGFNKTHGLRLRPGTGHGELWATNRPQDAPGSVLRIDAQTHAVIGQPLQTTGVAGDRPNNVEFTPDGRWAYVVNTGVKATKITIIDAEKFEVVAQIDQDAALGLAPHAITYDSKTQRMFVVNKDSPTVSAIDVKTNSVIRYITIGAEPHGITIGPDGQVWAVAKKGNKIAVIDPRSLTITAEITDAALVGPHSMVWVKTNPRFRQPAEDAEPVAFAETGYNLTGQFLNFWRANGGLPVLGYPISPIRAANGAVSQSFERGQLELHPGNAAPYTLELARVGVQALAQEGVDWWSLPSVDTAAPGCHYFAVTHHTLCGDFLAYWREHGLKLEDRGVSERESVALFGYPISEPQMERTPSGDTILAQWFERARFELHPSSPAGARVLLGRLGAELQTQQASTSDGGILWATTTPANAADQFAFYCD